MCYGLFNFGECCPFSVDIITAEAEDSVMARVRLTATGSSTIWSNGVGSALTMGCNYAPSFNGGGLVSLDNGPTGDGVYEFDIETGTLGAELTNLAFNEIYQECKGSVAMAFGLRRMDTAGTVTTFATASGGSEVAVVNAAGDMWRVNGADLMVRNHLTTVRQDLTSVAVAATALRSIVSTDGNNFYVLGSGGTTTELFRVTSGGAALLASHSPAVTSGTLTKLGNYIFWKQDGLDKVWRYSVATSNFKLFLERTSGFAWTPAPASSWGESFFVAYGDA